MREFLSQYAYHFLSLYHMLAPWKMCRWLTSQGTYQSNVDDLRRRTEHLLPPSRVSNTVAAEHIVVTVDNECCSSTRSWTTVKTICLSAVSTYIIQILIVQNK